MEVRNKEIHFLDININISRNERIPINNCKITYIQSNNAKIL